MKYITAFLASLIMFVFTSLLCSVACYKVFGEKAMTFMDIDIRSIVAMIIAAIVATATFKASLKAKTFKLYQKGGSDPESKDKTD